MTFCKVIVLNNSQNFSNLLDNSLTYRISEDLNKEISIGNFVYVPILDKVFSALVISLKKNTQPNSKLKKLLILSILN